MEIPDDIAEFFGRLAVFAETVQRRLNWFLALAGLASAAIAWQVYSMVSPWWWNLIKCGVIFLPILVWVFVWSLLSQLREGPELAAEIAQRPGVSLSGLRASSADRKPGLISLLSTIRELRNSDAYDTVTDTIGSVTLLANPFMIVLSFAMLVILFLLMIVAPFVVLF